ncbi:hypothetical protein SPRG_22384 [Saprolegnia parasitica CBS 223.65]|uniref:Uncharacterized protein n=1 Tax=Saprolegnia parasitica (strain CBS 223.65) TaxID=695850 RepID=A0A067BL57_SAPPC|nr:hypothetical protein SPRG_22384 [Saprolegnia parasitica CBS 223.65]KDO17465.1 hypothetical protein SPRG_22384 [Saprolegnia parasitica CBS 223.65]|eukprot:XP_012211827.1 hypothetical protein SPRG_22384 [Saprolegnia parasitica CBS 223.65]
MDLETALAIDKASPEGDSLVRKVLTQSMHLTHDENNASISDASTYSPQAPWTPKSLGRAKSAIIYRQTLNDNLMFLERNIFFFREWHMRFVSLQDDHILIYSCREKWEQGDPPDKVVRLNPTMFLSHMRVDTDKAESEFRRIVAMEKLVAQVTGPPMALLVYEKVSRVHELFAANSRREIESGTAPLGTEAALSPDVLHFFADHLKRKYAVFLILALAHGIAEEYIREAHERMCAENEATFAGVGAGTGDELQQVRDGQYGFADDASIDLYDKYRTAALNYYRMNYGDPSAAEEEDAIMHLPVMLHVALIRQERDEASALLEILQTVKRRLLEHTASEAASNNESTT